VLNRTSPEQRYIEYIQDVLITIHENLHELEERKNFAEPEELNYIEGKIASYREMIAILKSSAASFKLPEIGI